MGIKNKIELKTSKDGSHTLYVADLDEHYHSINGAVQESMHVFIQAGLEQVTKSSVSILEYGFGTGLNAFLTGIYKKDKEIHYTSMEKYPIDEGVISKLNYKYLFEEKYTQLYTGIHEALWDEEVMIDNGFYVHKMHCDFKKVELSESYDLIYFDAFAPEVQPNLWTREIFRSAYNALFPEGILTTYCAKGVVRRILQEVGFSVERLPGPPGKREMLRAVKL